MVESTRILLIDDNERSRCYLETVLGFLGEDTICATSSNWQPCVTTFTEQASQISLAIIGTCDAIHLQQLLADIYNWEAGIPFVLVGKHEVSGFTDSELQSRIIAKLEPDLSYQPVLDSLHKAKLFREHYSRLRNFEGVNNFNMFRSLVGKSKAIQRVRHMMGQVANTEVSVLITGESGTGKELVARNLHLNSARADKPFVPINCGAIPRELLESELFGHEKGSFTGAISSRVGRFELADGGTLFLDEIGDMPLTMQIKLLRVLQERSFERVGGIETIHTDVRILAATHKNLEIMIEEGSFRQDLYFRINVFPIEMPSLRERAEDVPLLLNELIGLMESEKRGSVRFNSGAIASLCRHSWLGNVREIANLVERMAILHPHGIIGINDLPKKFRYLSEASEKEGKSETFFDFGNSAISTNEKSDQSLLLPLHGLDLKEYLSNLEKDLIRQALQDSRGVVSRAAGRLHIRRTTLVEKMRKYNMLKKQNTKYEIEQEKGIPEQVDPHEEKLEEVDSLDLEGDKTAPG